MKQLVWKNYVFTSTIDFESETENLDNGYLKVVKDTGSMNHYYRFGDGDEWGPALKFKMDDIIPDQYCIIETSVTVKSEDLNHEAILVFEITNEDGSTIWKGSNLSDFIVDDGAWQNIYFADQLNVLDVKQEVSSTSILKVFLWNKGKKPIAVDDFSLKIRSGNNEVYSLLYEFKRE